MELFEKLVSLGFDPWIFILVISSGYFQKKYLAGIKVLEKMSSAHKTLFISGVFSAIYIAILITTTHEPITQKALSFFVSYIVATSFYEIILKPITDQISKIYSKPTE